MADFEIRVNGAPYSLWKSVEIERSLDANTGIFSFESSNRDALTYPVRAGDAVQILANRIPVLTGFVDRVDATLNTDDSIINVRGRDNVADVIDSSVPDAVKNISTPTNFLTMCRQTITALGADIDVLDQSGASLDFGEDVQISADSGTNCMGFLTDFARKLQVYLISDGRGRMVIFRPGATAAFTSLQVGVNVKSRQYTHDNSTRFGRYVVRSQDNFGFDDAADYEGEGVARTGVVTDTAIRSSRYMELQGEETLDGQQVGNRAQEEANIRRARSTEWSTVVADVVQENGALWDIGQLVTIRDPDLAINGTRLIRSVRYMQDIETGTTCEIVTAPLDAYQVRGVMSNSDARREGSDTRLVNRSGPISARDAR